MMFIKFLFLNFNNHEYKYSRYDWSNRSRDILTQHLLYLEKFIRMKQPMEIVKQLQDTMQKDFETNTENRGNTKEFLFEIEPDGDRENTLWEQWYLRALEEVINEIDDCEESKQEQLKEMFEKDYKQMLSIDLYNILMDQKNHKNKNIIANVLKNRGETDLLYSLYINTHHKQ